MGCLCDKSNKSKDGASDTRKPYSWEEREQTVDPSDYTLDDVQNTEYYKQPGTINGQQFIIRNCKNASIYLKDHINTLTIDDCHDCKFIIGPVKGSLFLRDCKNCSCLAACGQFRMRDCYSINVFLCCPTQPIIESSRRIHFGCYQLYYDQLEDHFRSAGLSVFNNNWSNVHDFTPSHVEVNWSLLPPTTRIQDYFCLVQNQVPMMCLDKAKSVVPFTVGVYPDVAEDLEVCLVVFFHDKHEETLSKTFIKKFLEDRPSCWLVSCRQLSLDARDAEVVFSSPAYNKEAEAGPLVGLVLAGSRAIYSCQKTVEKVAQVSHCVYVSTNPRTSAIQAETFTSVASMLLYS